VISEVVGRSAAVSSIAVFATLLFLGCDECPDCAQGFDLVLWCMSSGACTLDDLPARCDCCPPSLPCPLVDLPRGSTLAIPIAQLWPTLGPRDDLSFFLFARTPSSVVDHPVASTLSFDGVPTSCPRGPVYFECRPVPPSVQLIELRFDDPDVDTASPALVMRDGECDDEQVEHCKK
jgi:hypothetical protein